MEVAPGQGRAAGRGRRPRRRRRDWSDRAPAAEATTTGIDGAGPSPPRGQPESRSTKSAQPLELFFDLVFVFAITEVTGFVPTTPTGRCSFQGIAILAALWFRRGVLRAGSANHASDQGRARTVCCRRSARCSSLRRRPFRTPSATTSCSVSPYCGRVLDLGLHRRRHAWTIRSSPTWWCVAAARVPAAAVLIVVAGVVDAEHGLVSGRGASPIDYGGYVAPARGLAADASAPSPAPAAIVIIIALGQSSWPLGVGQRLRYSTRDDHRRRGNCSMVAVAARCGGRTRLCRASSPPTRVLRRSRPTSGADRPTVHLPDLPMVTRVDPLRGRDKRCSATSTSTSSRPGGRAVRRCGSLPARARHAEACATSAGSDRPAIRRRSAARRLARSSDDGAGAGRAGALVAVDRVLAHGLRDGRLRGTATGCAMRPLFGLWRGAARRIDGGESAVVGPAAWSAGRCRVHVVGFVGLSRRFRRGRSWRSALTCQEPGRRLDLLLDEAVRAAQHRAPDGLCAAEQCVAEVAGRIAGRGARFSRACARMESTMAAVDLEGSAIAASVDREARRRGFRRSRATSSCAAGTAAGVERGEPARSCLVLGGDGLRTVREAVEVIGSDGREARQIEFQ